MFNNLFSHSDLPVANGSAAQKKSQADLNDVA